MEGLTIFFNVTTLYNIYLLNPSFPAFVKGFLSNPIRFLIFDLKTIVYLIIATLSSKPLGIESLQTGSPLFKST